jgi:SAM-dependent methyltransferase
MASHRKRSTRPHASPTEKNRRHWDEESDAYQRRHGRTLRRTPLAWGVWRIPEEELRVLGDLRGKTVLELGCGAAQWSIALARLGARPVGIDLSERQLGHARKAMRRAEVAVPLVQATAEQLPFASARFDAVFCDHGATTFTDPRRTVPEVSRVLRPGGLFVFSQDTPIHFVSWDEKKQLYGRSLRGDYFEMRSAPSEVSVVFNLPYGEWVRLFREEDFVIEDLIELRPPAGARTTYEDYGDVEWARRWPAEHIWKLRKKAPRTAPLVGVAEAAAILGWDKRRVATYIRRGSFPAPLASLASGRVWDRADIEAFATAFRARRAARAARRATSD